MPQAEKICRVLRNADGPLTGDEIADVLGLAGRNSIYHSLEDLNDSDKIKQVEKNPKKWVLTMVDEAEESNKTKLSLESDIQDYLDGRLDKTELGLSIESEITGPKKEVDSGEIDILAEDADGNLVVIEIKAGKARRAVLGQIKAYMADVIDNLSDTGDVKGIIIAEDFSQKLTRAMTLEEDVELYTYRVELSLDKFQ